MIMIVCATISQLKAQAQGITPATSVGVPGVAVSRVSRHARALVDSFTVLRVVSSTPQRTWTLEVDVDTTEDPVRCVTVV
ncbi:hypothetical protein CSPX01_04896 [Colletotrichum filicis]|nr:hypothetical protein CSPX01_04896 [Colletotrichum filicis]